MKCSRKERVIDPAGFISMIHVDRDCDDHPLTREIIARAGNIPVKFVAEEKFSIPVLGSYPKSLNRGKHHLLLTKNRGKFFKPCPGTREYVCCDYQVLNIGMNCPMDCVYCILQAYLNNPYLSFFVNTEDLLAELKQVFAHDPHHFRRIGTGEFTDSLALDRLTGLSRILIEFMRDKNSAVLELKTKTAVIDNLAGLDHGGRTIVAWSLNSPVIVAKEEIRTASLEQRLAAAARCASWGYKLAFHFDPIIYHEGWQQGYSETIRRLFATVPKENIAWISLGCLRYLPQLKQIAGQRFPNSRFFYEEFIEGLDGKARYFRTLRVEMYQHLYQQLLQHADSRTCIYLCMENNEIWQEVFGFIPDDRGGLPRMLDETVNHG
ncbi:MAG: DNA photolyase [Desulfobacterales bacterium SG8_35_2]|nr:MAG: DNA photolyase [Desulfobacterales bacterium SG8_35_2]